MSKDQDNEWQTKKSPDAVSTATSPKRIRIKKKRLLGDKTKKKSEKIDFGNWPIIFASVLAIAALVAIVVFYNSTVNATKNADAPAVDSIEEEWQGLLPAEVAKRFIAATTNEERLKWVRDPEEIAPLLVDFFTNGAGATENILNHEPMPHVTTEKFIIHRNVVNLHDGSRRLLCVVQMGNRAYVDFKAYARYASSKWQDLLSGDATSAAEVRVMLEPGTAYMSQYADEAKWSSYIATTPDWEMPLYFYIARDSKTDGTLRALTNTGAQRATLSIRSTDNSHEKKQFEIVELLAPGWCY
jgi:hypothetical protein